MLFRSLSGASAAPTATPSSTGLLLAVTAQRDLGIEVTIDGGDVRRFSLVTGESRSFEADTAIVLALDEGSSARIVVNGIDLGMPGAAGVPWTYTFTPGDALLSPTPAATPTGSLTPDPSASASASATPMGSATGSAPTPTPSA